MVSTTTARPKTHPLIRLAARLWSASVVALLATLWVVLQRAIYACPALPGCRSDAFVVGDARGLAQLGFRLALFVVLVLAAWAALRFGRGVQAKQLQVISLVPLVCAVALALVGLVWNWQWREGAIYTASLVLGVGLTAASGWLWYVARHTPLLPLQRELSARSILLRDYVTLTKPRVISLLLLTTLATMLIATTPAYPLGFALVVWTLVGGYLASGGANAINMYLDRDVDALMGRTSRRPLPSSRMQPIHALIFGIVLNILAFGLLWWQVNLLTAALALGGTLYYVFIYTRLLKRSTYHNIIIGGAAGAVPPLVGWAAVRGEMNLLPIILFAIIFYWTPPHFWALALMRRADYARAGIPMLPVAKGEAETKWQILLYSFLMVAISIILAPLRLVGPIYLILALVLGLRFMVYAFRLFREPGTALAWPLYKYSLLYLALLFAALVIDHSIMTALAYP